MMMVPAVSLTVGGVEEEDLLNSSVTFPLQLHKQLLFDK